MTGRETVPAGNVLLISGFDPAGEGRGGLFAWDGSRLLQVDACSTTGLRMCRGELLRCLWNYGKSYAGLVITGVSGKSWRLRLDGVGNPHDVLADGDLAAVVATEQNQVVWFGRDGRRVRVWQPEGESDSWHLNGLVEHQGRLLICAFGRFSRRKEWDELGQPASGCLVAMETGAAVIEGLRAPHTPRFVGGRWVLCNSADGEVIAVEPDGSRYVLVKLNGWPRGLVVTERAAFVGLSPARRDLGQRDATSKVIALDPATWQLLDEVAVPVREIYDLALVPESMLTALPGGR